MIHFHSIYNNSKPQKKPSRLQMPRKPQPSAPRSANHRKYHRASTFTPDQQAFINYLLQRRYDLTLKIFQEEIEERAKGQDQGQWLERMGKDGGVGVEEFRRWVDGLRGRLVGAKGELVRLEFMLIVWLCSCDRNKISPQKLKLLRNFIQKNGIKLSQYPQLLPYFALPYIPDPSTHPFLSKIYTPEWKQQVKSLLGKHSHCPPPMPIPMPMPSPAANQQHQWYTIVKDLIEICLYLSEEVSVKDGRHWEKIERVRRYQRVIQDNDGGIFGELGKENDGSGMGFVAQGVGRGDLDGDDARSIESISSVHERQLQPINFDALKQTLAKLNPSKPRQHRQLCQIYNALHSRILCSPSLRKQTIESYTHNDIFFLSSSPSSPTSTPFNPSKLQQIECLKLMNTMCSSNKCIRYLSASQPLIAMLCRIVVRDKGFYLGTGLAEQGEGVEERLFQVFGVLQKVLLNKEVVGKVMKTQLVSVLVLDYAVNFQILPSSILTYVLALILNIILKPQGKLYCSSLKCPLPKSAPKPRQHPISLFELIIKIWKHLISSPPAEQTQLQSLIYSLLYVLLSIEQNKQIARSINFKAMMEKFVRENDDEYHRKVVQSIVEVLASQEGEDSWMQGEDGEGEGQGQGSEMWEDGDEGEDEGNREDRGFLWVGDRVVQLMPSQSRNIQSILQKFYIKNHKQQAKKQNPPQPIDKLQANHSTPLLENKNNLGVASKEPKSKLKTQEIVMVNNSQRFQKVSGYDPSKYEAWKRLKTSKH